MYRALYRKWRPKTFSDVVGQAGITAALQNQITHDKVGHAYLFTGTRGTGKTSCAKIFAKAVNCPHRTGADPCCECEICKGIDNGSVMDVVEIDAASNNGVDNIRDLRDETAYTPSQCTYKVYIIDEVHMLSTAAFNALLKIMEEPPAHVIFILATTEIHKVPATILSRCQRYDFMRIKPQDIEARLLYVAGQEGIQLAQDAAELISRLADGAMRDALSILDTCAGVGGEVTQQLVRRMAGVTDKSYLFDISDAVLRARTPQGCWLWWHSCGKICRRKAPVRRTDFALPQPSTGRRARRAGVFDGHKRRRTGAVRAGGEKCAASRGCARGEGAERCAG